MDQKVKSIVESENVIVSLFKLRWKLLAIFGLCIGLSIAVLIFSDPQYQAEVKTLPTEMAMPGIGEAGSLGALAGLAGISIPKQSSIKYEALEILQSTTFINSFIASNDFLHELFAEKWDAESEKWRKQMWGREPTIADGSKRFIKKMLRVREDRRTGIIAVSIKWHDREQAAGWANKLVTTLNAEMRRRAIDDADAKLKYLYDEVEKTNNVEIKQALYGLIQNEIESAMLAQVREDYALRIIDYAQVPEKSDKISPKAGLVLVGGASFGILLGFLLLGVRRIRLLLQGTEIGGVDAGKSAQ